MVKAVKKAKNDWLQEKANEVQLTMLSEDFHRSMWKSLRESQRGKVGLRPITTKTIKKVNGNPCESVDKSVKCCQRHFCQVLNVQSRYVKGTVSSE